MSTTAVRHVVPTDNVQFAIPIDSSAAPLDVEALADCLHDNPRHAATLLARLTPAQRHRQALAYAAWLNAHSLPVALDTVLAAWDALITEHIPPTPLLDPALFADLIWVDPTRAAVLLAAMPLPTRTAQAAAHATFLADHHLVTDGQRVLAGWETVLLSLVPLAGSDVPLPSA